MQHVRGASTRTNLLEYVFQRKKKKKKKEKKKERGGWPKIIANSVPQNLRSTSYVRNLTLSSNSRQLDVSFLFLEEDYSVGEDGEESAVFDEP